MPSSNRIGELDGFRALAILSVVFYHYAYYWTRVLPWSTSVFPGFARGGDFGITLFFVISGFVIALTLRNCRSPLEFAVRRFARLWPPMLVCSTLTFLVVSLVSNPISATLAVDPSSFLPSLTFTDPGPWHVLFPDAGWIDGAYWTLAAEARFYVWAAILFFCARRERFALHITAFAALSVTAGALAAASGHVKMAYLMDLVANSRTMMSFVIGVLIYEIWQGRREPWLFVAIAGFVASYNLGLIERGAPIFVSISGHSLTAGIAILLFALLLWRREWVAWANLRAARFIGICSYPLYLLHQKIGVTLLYYAGAGLSDWYYRAVILAMVAVMIGLAWLVHVAVEEPGQAAGRAVVRWLRARSGPTVTVGA